jgi:nucleoside-diphosphate-sugar epimerase
MKVLITGKNGYVGKSLINKLKNTYTITGIGRDDFDLSNREFTNLFFKDKYFDVVIHTAVSGGHRLEKEDSKIFHNNISMFYNLLINQNHYSHFINLSSGAELGKPTSPYGLSKNIIHKLIQFEEKFSSILSFGIFDENERDTRFIKSNIRRYKNKEPLIIHQNKLMDFFYMDDFVSLVKYLIQNPKIKDISASYYNTHDLLEIASIINNLDTHKCNIILEDENKGKAYISPFQEKLNIPLIGLKEGIRRTYYATN